MSVNDAERQTDATVNNDDGLRWVREMLHEPQHVVLGRFMAVEPTVAGVAVRVANAMREQLVANGVSGRLAAYASDKLLLTAVICGELMRRGHAQLWHDMAGSDQLELNDIQPGDDDEQPTPR